MAGNTTKHSFMLIKNFLQLADSLPDALLLIDSDGKIITANKKVSKFLKSSTQDLTGRHLNEIADFRKDELHESLHLWRRSRIPIPVSIKWKHISIKDKPQHHCQAFLLQPACNMQKALIILRCAIGKSAISQFTELNSALDRQQLTLKKLQASRDDLELAYEKASVTLHSIGDAVITTDVSGCVE